MYKNCIVGAGKKCETAENAVSIVTWNLLTGVLPEFPKICGFGLSGKFLVFRANVDVRFNWIKLGYIECTYVFLLTTVTSPSSPPSTTSSPPSPPPMIPTIMSTIAQTRVFALFAPTIAMTPQIMLTMPP